MTRLLLLGLVLSAGAVDAQTRVGTACEIQAEATTGSANCNIDASADLAVAMWTNYHGTSTDGGLSDLEIDNVDLLPATAVLRASANGDHAGVGVAVLANPTTGATVAVDWVWDTAITSGGQIVIFYVQDATNPSAVVDSATDGDDSQGGFTATVNSDTGDLVFALYSAFNSTEVLNEANTIVVNDFCDTGTSICVYAYDVDEGTPTTPVTTNSSFFGGLVAISIEEGAGGGGLSIPIIMHHRDQLEQ